MKSDPGSRPATPTLQPTSGRSHALLFSAVLIIGILARAWQFGHVPPGLNPDEASIAVESYDLSTFGIDRNGMSYPVQFIAWGDGQSVPYAYLLMPVLALTHRLTPTIVRFPMLVVGIASLPLVYLLGRWLETPNFGLLSMFCLAISPWHVVLSRWALDANLLPFAFLTAFICFLASAKARSWFVPGCVLLAFSLYTYATAYAVVPIFLTLVLLINARMKVVPAGPVILGLAAFAVTALPIGLFVLVNTADLPSMQLGPISIPRYPVAPRYETQTVLRSPDPGATLISNVETASALLWTQSDGFVQNTVEPFGYFYKITLPLALGGVLVLVAALRRRSQAWESALLLAWLGASLVLTGFLAVNVNQFNIVFIPLIVSIALSIDWLGRRIPAIAPISLVALAAGFIAFNLTYHGAAYRQAANLEFRAGILPALQYAEQASAGPICVSEASGQYIYPLYLDHPNPAAYLPTLRYDDPLSSTRNVVSLGRYTFGINNCAGRSDWTYVLSTQTSPPHLGNRYDYRFFDGFVVYIPKPG